MKYKLILSPEAKEDLLEHAQAGNIDEQFIKVIIIAAKEHYDDK